MTGKNYSEKAIVELGVLEYLDKVMDVAVDVDVDVELLYDELLPP
jgi:hypothetical protein